MLIRTRAVIDDCKKHSDIAGLTGTPIESYLVQHALVVFCAEIEREVYKLVDVLSDQYADEALSGFVKVAAKRMLRSVKKEELSGFAKHFGEAAKTRFNDGVEESDVAAYNLAVSNRHEVAHANGAQVTMPELTEAVEAAERIIGALDQAIVQREIPKESLA